MITTEKGFQANSKTITTTENLMNTLIQLKR
jgi:flagellar hook protein FlgE